MSKLDVRIARLEPMRVASFHGYGEVPERLAGEKLRAWAAGRESAGRRRVFGFNNPNPSHGTPNYGYEFWAELEAGEEAGESAEEKSFGGGLYAVTRVVGASNIMSTWEQLVAWMEASGYEHAEHQWLEEDVGPPNASDEELTLDLYLPIEG